MKRKFYLKLSTADRRNYLEQLVMRVFGTKFDYFRELTEIQTGNPDAAADQLLSAGDRFVIHGTLGRPDCRFMVRERFYEALERASRSLGEDGHDAGFKGADEEVPRADAGGNGGGAA